MLVSTGPGVIAFTEIPAGPRIWAIDHMMWSTAILLAL